jgi:hypothetical protein
MQKRPATLGAILAEMGRITPAEVEQALDYQRAHGGYFGEALVALDLLSAEEVKFALADQYDLPFVHLQSEAIDHAVARMVPPEWARQHQLIPVLRAGDAVTVLSPVPPPAENVDAVLGFTGASRAELAISTPETINQLIDAVHGESRLTSSRLTDWFHRGIAAGASSLGVSARARHVAGWYWARGGEGVRGVMDEGWRDELTQIVTPFPARWETGVSEWPAILTLGERAWRVECGLVGNAGGAELVLHVGAAVPGPSTRAVAAPEVLVAYASRSGDRIAVRASLAADRISPEVLELLLPGLPDVLAGRPLRSLHISDRPVAVVDGSLVLHPTGSLADLLSSMETFRLDAVTLDVSQIAADDLTAARRVAPLIVFRDTFPRSHRLRSDLHVCLSPDPSPRWDLAS